MTHKGIDVSHYQGVIDFDEVKKDGIEFVVVKATQGSEAGSHIVDAMFRNNVINAHKAGLTVHVYHYFLGVSESDAKAEAEWLIKNITPLKSYIDFVFCDVEASSLSHDKHALTRYVNAFFDECEKKGFHKLGIYSGKSFYETRLVESELKHGLLKWIARYNETLGIHADIWQHSQSGVVKGIHGRVDLDVAYTDAVVKPKVSSTHTVSLTLPKPTLRKGDKGIEVKHLQDALNHLGFSVGHADSDFGAHTESGLKGFQKHYGLTADGIYGSHSEAKLKTLI